MGSRTNDDADDSVAAGGISTTAACTGQADGEQHRQHCGDRDRIQARQFVSVDTVALGGRGAVRRAASRLVAVIRIDAIWLAVEPMDMRAGSDTALARVVKVFGAARPHHAYLFANRRGNRMKVLIHDGIGVWLAARRLNRGRFVWPEPGLATRLALTPEQLQALVVGLPWQRLGEDGVITLL
jgi:hypothetical protein